MPSWLEAAVTILETRGATEIFELVKAARVNRDKLKFGAQQIYRLATRNERGLKVVEYPCFGVKSGKLPSDFPKTGRLPAAYSVLVLTRGYVDVRELGEKIRGRAVYRTISDCPEYWLYEALTNCQAVFSQRGSLRIGLVEAGASTGVAIAGVKAGTPTSVTSFTANIHEANLESLIIEDLGRIEEGLSLVGRQYPAPPVGRIDLLCKDRRGNLVVIELKKFAAQNQNIIDQITRYIGWVKLNLAKPGQKVRGVIVVGSADEKLTYSAKAIPGLETKCFDVSIRNF